LRSHYAQAGAGATADIAHMVIDGGHIDVTNNIILKVGAEGRVEKKMAPGPSGAIPVRNAQS
jgi:hypothetical protein